VHPDHRPLLKPSTHPVGALLGPAPPDQAFAATTSGLCSTAFGGSVLPGTSIHGMTQQVFATERDSGLCMDPPPVTIEPPIVITLDPFEERLAELEGLIDDGPGVFDPSDMVDWR
jgi:hypothetical protein